MEELFVTCKLNKFLIFRLFLTNSEQLEFIKLLLSALMLWIRQNHQVLAQKDKVSEVFLARHFLGEMMQELAHHHLPHYRLHQPKVIIDNM